MRPPMTPDSTPAPAARPEGKTAPWMVAFGALLLAYGLGVQSGPAAAVNAPAAFGAPGPFVQGGNPPVTATPDPRPTPGYGAADSNHRMIAVTGVDLTGQSVLYLVDTIDKQLAIYQASGGGTGTSGVKLVGARRIDLDLALHGYNDKSEYKYKDLEKEFQKLQAR